MADKGAVWEGLVKKHGLKVRGGGVVVMPEEVGGSRAWRAREGGDVHCCLSAPARPAASRRLPLRLNAGWAFAGPAWHPHQPSQVVHAIDLCVDRFPVVRQM